jgi:hypothetical protein
MGLSGADTSLSPFTQDISTFIFFNIILLLSERQEA